MGKKRWHDDHEHRLVVTEDIHTSYSLAALFLKRRIRKRFVEGSISLIRALSYSAEKIELKFPSYDEYFYAHGKRFIREHFSEGIFRNNDAIRALESFERGDIKPRGIADWASLSIEPFGEV